VPTPARFIRPHLLALRRIAYRLRKSNIVTPANNERATGTGNKTKMASTTTTPNEQQLKAMLFSAAQELFTSMLGTDVQSASDTDETASASFDGILSMVGITGSVVGNGALICSAETACDLASRFLMTEFTQVDDSVIDAIGEITNMIVGGFKNLLEAELGRLQMSIPTVAHAQNISLRNLRAEVTADLLCVWQGHDVRLQVGLARNRG